MFGALIKTFYAEKLGLDPAKIVSVALMPCSAKKFECNRPEMHDSGFQDVDYGLTTRELGKMFRESGHPRAAACRRPTSTTRSARPPAPASSSAPPAA